MGLDISFLHSDDDVLSLIQEVHEKTAGGHPAEAYSYCKQEVSLCPTSTVLKLGYGDPAVHEPGNNRNPGSKTFEEPCSR